MFKKYAVVAVVVLALVSILAASSYAMCGTCGAGESSADEGKSAQSSGELKDGQALKCGHCGTEVTVTKAAGGNLVCCGKAMKSAQ